MMDLDFRRSSIEYCENCGYGADAAVTKLRGQMTGLWGACGVGILFGLIAWKRVPAGLAGMALFAVEFFVLYPLARSFVAGYRLSKISAIARRIRIPRQVAVRLNAIRAPERTQQDDEQVWNEYYRLRNRARLSLVILPVALYAVFYVPAWLLLRLNGLPPGGQVAIVFILIGVGAVLFSAPLLQWAEWKCPRCRHKFVQPRIEFGLFALIFVLPKLLFDSHCAKCKLFCGAPMSFVAHSH